ncbi:uncharacterized protein Z518_04317 [Rhinocladiella mackenziei CBS 650.93]|uniref:Rhinocladiella mackenziei CBS 650.93 unplaced genomic scaffold supercont1.3, whole genome shotgun sequence n=1 Tax=Rhinocladiella mackenziei CBS 650.93 TaxID=1442369 RepID=A0A0D2IT23_9EURO|nr:uncharacterized protein Z518_04317 [Rhinocladiella mackenziei CBS 650.93]KIX06341.1 hypothetical protein Z518_04317 [Rhinocladiella mackenziei CBS 650.93]
MTEQSRSQSAAKNGQTDKEGEMDLTTILDEAQRTDLTLLIATLTESMRNLIQDNFDSTAALDKSSLRESMTEEENDRERKIKEESDQDLETVKMRTLKRDSLRSFDEWREQVTFRVSQAVNGERIAQEQAQKNAGMAQPSKPQAPAIAGKIMEAPTRAVNLKFKNVFPPARTALTKLPMGQRTLILHSILLLLLSLEHYTAYSRILMLNLTSSLKLPLKTFEQDEYTTAKGLLDAAKEMTADEERKKKVEQSKDSRKWKVGLATAAGAAIIGVTGGLAAPLVAAGVGSVMGGLGLGATTAAAYLGSVAGSSVVVGGLFGAYGGRMTGQMMDAYAREVEDFQFLPVHGRRDKKTQDAQQASEHDHKLRVTIGISGWLTEKEEVVKPWGVLGSGAEVFALKWELEALLNLGNAINGMVQSAAWGYARKEIIQRTIFANLAVALWPIGLLKVARVIDNPFSVAKSRADKAGEVLADALANRAQGERPVTLIGYSLGARVIYACLMSLAKRKEFGIIENAILMGSPTSSDTSDWRTLRSVVAGRLVNVFSTTDYVLGFMYRTSAIQYGVAGLQKVEGLSGVENFDASEDVTSHHRYRYLIGAILQKIGFEDIDMVTVEKEQELLLKMEEEEKNQSIQSQRRWLMRRQSNGGKEDEAAEADAEANELEKKIHDQTQKSLMTRAIEYFYKPGVPGTGDAGRVDGNVRRAGQDSPQAGNVVGQTAQDVPASTQSYATRLYKSVQSMPHTSRSTPTTTNANATSTADTKQATDQATKAAGGATGHSQSYVQTASSYLRSMPSLARSSKSQGQSQSATSNATDSAIQAAETTASAAKDTANLVSDTDTPTVTNTQRPRDNPAVKSTKHTPDKAPIIHQAKDRTPTLMENVTGDVVGAAGTTAQDTGQSLSKGLDTTTGAVGDVEKVATSRTQGAAKTGQQQSYTSREAEYLSTVPTMPNISIPKIKFGESDPKKSQPPILEERTSGTGASARPPPLKLDQVKSPSPISLPKPEHVPSGVKSPPKPDRVPSSALGERLSGIQGRASDAGREAVRQGKSMIEGVGRRFSGFGSGKQQQQK